MVASDITQNGPDDLALVEAIQRGDIQALGRLVDRHLDHLHAFISLRLPVAHLVDEITHETFVFAYHHIQEFTTGTAVRAWLRAIASNKIRAEIERYCREERNRLHYAEHLQIEIALSENESETSREVEALNQCLEKVPPHQRELITLKYHDEHSTADIARRVQRSLAWVRTTLCRLRQELRECLKRTIAKEQA